MAIRTYTQTDINIISEFIDGSGGSVTGTLLSRVVSAIQGMAPGTTHKESDYGNSFYINFSAFPAIPANALISKVRFYIDYSLNVDVNGFFGDPVGSFASVQFNDIAAIFGVMSDNLSVGPPPGNGGNGDNKSARLDKTVDFPVNITRTQLDLYFGIAGGFILSLDASVDNGGSDPASGNASVTSGNYTFEVTYTAGPFSWYLQTHTSIIGGKPSIVVDDIVAVDDGSEVPANSVFYGTGENFPTEADIPLYNWYDPVSFTILNQPIRPASGWLLQLVDFIGDSVGDMQLDVALESILILMTDPSGIYTLVEGQRHDTLYERFVGVPSINVKIPDPFAKTGFIP